MIGKLREQLRRPTDRAGNATFVMDGLTKCHTRLKRARVLFYFYDCQGKLGISEDFPDRKTVAIRRHLCMSHLV
jgi:hypothetical protein